VFHYIQGALSIKQPTQIVLDVQGVGYELSIPISTYQKLPDLNQQVKLLTHFHIREDAQQLFGFYTEAERTLFRVLTSVSGIGPKVGLAMLSSVEVSDIKMAIVGGDLTVLTAIPGIGKKTAERIVVELKEKIVVDEIDKKNRAALGSDGDEALSLGVAALTQLGYKKVDADKVIRKVIEKEGTDISVELLLKESLKNI